MRPAIRTGLIILALAGAAAAATASPAGQRPADPTEHVERSGSADLIVTGRVSDADGGGPLAGAQVWSVSSGEGTTTAGDGRYTLRLPAESLPARGGKVHLRARLVGYEEASREIALPAGVGRGAPGGADAAAADTVRIDFALRPVSVSLEEVVVSGVADAARPGVAGKLAAVAPQAYRSHAGPTGVPRPGEPGDPIHHPWPPPEMNREGYDRILENPFLAADANPLSTFAVDVDRASYGNVRRFLTGGSLPPADAVRIEELVNYFAYDLPEPDGEHPFTVTTEVAPAPWRPAHRLLRIGLQARRVEMADLPPANLVFLVDVSGSMQPANKLPLLKSALRLLVDQLRPEDRVAMVVYAGAAGLVLPSTPGDRKEEILQALERLEAGGTTAGGEGLRLAYDVAERHLVEGGNNRVILATDGDFNVGPSSDAAMVRLVEEERRSGTFLTVLGFGTGNLQDAKMEKLADHGNGNYAYIDGLLEARKVLVHEVGGTLLTVAKDVKVQVEFNPARVAGYRLIGYENRLLRAEDFDDDTKDAGEIGAGHSVTALYEVVPAGAETEVEIRRPDSLRYRDRRPQARGAGDVEAPGEAVASASDELLYVKLRYKAPDGETSRLLAHPVLATEDRGRPSTDLRFASAVAGFGMLLRDSEHRGAWTMKDVLAAARGAVGDDPEGYRAEFVRLAERARDLLPPERAGGHETAAGSSGSR